MELMATCLDKLLKKLREPLPERILGKITVAVSSKENGVVWNWKESRISDYFIGLVVNYGISNTIVLEIP